jgi:Tol biopolymer transport system component
MSQHRPCVVVVALATVALTVAVAATGSSASRAQNGQIAWKSFALVDGTWSIYVANPDGSNRRRLTHPGAGVHDDLPDWSPDGSHILFDRNFQPLSNVPTVADEVMRVDADGGGLRQIGTCMGNCVANDDPQYSPDGHQVVYTQVLRVKGTSSLALGVWLMDSDGRHPHQISPAIAGKSEDHEPAWSPDGRHVVFTRLNDSAAPTNKQSLFIIASTGGKARQLTPWSLNAGGANWSPDGARILFQSYRDCPCSQTSQVYTVAVNGSGLTRLTSVGRNIEPNWAPDGKKIIYARQPSAGSTQLPDLWVMDSNGRNQEPLLRTKLWDSEPDWGTAPPETR